MEKKDKHDPKVATGGQWPEFLGSCFGMIVILAIGWFLGGLVCAGT